MLSDLFEKKCRNYSKSFNALNFELVNYEDEKGESRPMYEMTKDGFAVLVLGFTGNLAAKFQEAFLKEFNRRGVLIQSMNFHALPAPKRKNYHTFGYHKLEKTLDGKSKLIWITGAKRIEDMTEIEYHAWKQSKRARSGLGQVKALISELLDDQKYQEENLILLDMLIDLSDRLQVKQASPQLMQRILFEDYESCQAS